MTTATPLPRAVRRTRVARAAAGLLAAALLAGCASTPGQAGGPHPVFYPNARFNQVGAAQAQADAGDCMGRAQAAGVSPTPPSQAGSGAVRGGAIGATAGAVGALIGGRSVADSAVRGAAVGGATGAVAGSFRGPQVNPLFRNFVDRCLRERGYDVIGWSSD
jgi:hypothetical protein